MKLHAKDLMIGDYVQCPATNHIFKVQTISGGEQDTLHYVTAKNWNGDFLSRSEWDGVPITAEILKKNFPDTEILVWYGNEYKWHIECPAFEDWQVGIEIECVHQLQHILRLYGFEKEIQL